MPPTQRAALALGQRDEIATLEGDAAAGDTAGAGQHAHQCPRERRFATPAFADKPDDAAGRNVEIDAIDRTHNAVARGVADHQIADRQKGHARSASLGNSSFSEPRDTRNPASTISTIANPGGVNQFHAPRPSA
jgi:hypothetical protein